MYCCRNGYVNISPEEGRNLLIHNPNILLIDVRTPEEYITGHIPGSINIPVEVLAQEIINLPISIYTPIMVYCQRGIKASYAASMLVNMGFINVFNLGGISNWHYEIVA